MTNAEGYLIVGGKFVTQSSVNDASYYNYLTAGTLELKGDFLQMASNSGNFVCKGEHRVIFSGDEHQTIVFEYPTYSGFNILAGTPNSDTDVTGRIAKLECDAKIGRLNNYQSLDLNGYKLVITGDLVGDGNIYVNGSKLTVEGNVILQNGTFSVGSGEVIANNDFLICKLATDDEGNVIYDTSSAVFQMTDNNGYVYVGGDFVTRSRYNVASYYNNIKAGTLELAGNFTQKSSNSDNFVAYGTHKTILCGTTEQTITFENPKSSHFNILDVTFAFDTSPYQNIPASRIISESTLVNLSAISTTNCYIHDEVSVAAVAAAGKGNYAYAMFYKLSTDTKWQTIGVKYGRFATGTFAPDKDGTYNVMVNVMDEEGIIKSKKFTLTVKLHNLGNQSSVSASTVEAGTKVTLYGKGTGGTEEYTYALMYKPSESNTWIAIGTKYGTESTGSFVPDEAGDYDILITVKDSAGTTSAKKFTLKVTPSTALANKSSLSAEKITAGNAVTLSGKAEGGEGDYTYAFMYKLTGATSWKVIGTKYGTSDTETLTIKTAGEYNVLISVKDSTGKTVAKRFALTVEAAKPLTNNSVVSAQTVSAGTKVTLNALAEGGEGDYTYALMYKLSSSSSWKTIGTKYGTADTGAFTPTAVGEYDILISVKDSTGKTAAKKFKLTVTEAVKALKNNSTISAESIMAGTNVTLSALAEGGAGDYTYAFMYKTADSSSWKTIGKKYGTDAVQTFSTKTPGTYDILISVKDSSGKTAAKRFQIEVKQALTNNSTVSAETVTAGTPVIINAVAQGGEGNYTYALMYKLSSSSSWKTIGTKYGTADTGSFTPTAAGDYDVLVSVKDETGKTAAKKFKVTAE